MNTININKKYQTACGYKVNLYWKDPEFDARPIHGAYFDGEVWNMAKWCIDGKLFSRGWRKHLYLVPVENAPVEGVS